MLFSLLGKDNKEMKYGDFNGKDVKNKLNIN
jgi:hypothetical protein